MLPGRVRPEDGLSRPALGGKAAMECLHIFREETGEAPSILSDRLVRRVSSPFRPMRDSSGIGVARECNRVRGVRTNRAYFGPSWTLVSVRAGHARRLDFDTVLGRSGQLRFGHLDDAGPPSRR